MVIRGPGDRQHGAHVNQHGVAGVWLRQYSGRSRRVAGVAEVFIGPLSVAYFARHDVPLDQGERYAQQSERPESILRRCTAGALDQSVNGCVHEIRPVLYSSLGADRTPVHGLTERPHRMIRLQ